MMFKRNFSAFATMLLCSPVSGKDLVDQGVTDIGARVDRARSIIEKLEAPPPEEMSGETAGPDGALAWYWNNWNNFHNWNNWNNFHNNFNNFHNNWNNFHNNWNNFHNNFNNFHNSLNNTPSRPALHSATPSRPNVGTWRPERLAPPQLSTPASRPPVLGNQRHEFAPSRPALSGPQIHSAPEVTGHPISPGHTEPHLSEPGRAGLAPERLPAHAPGQPPEIARRPPVQTGPGHLTLNAAPGSLSGRGPIHREPDQGGSRPGARLPPVHLPPKTTMTPAPAPVHLIVAGYGPFYDPVYNDDQLNVAALQTLSDFAQQEAQQDQGSQEGPGDETAQVVAGYQKDLEEYTADVADPGAVMPRASVPLADVRRAETHQSGPNAPATGGEPIDSGRQEISETQKQSTIIEDASQTEEDVKVALDLMTVGISENLKKSGGKSRTSAGKPGGGKSGSAAEPADDAKPADNTSAPPQNGQ